MKSTIFAILVVVLMAGLTLVEMNANTPTPFSVLTDAEMLTTQGAGRCPTLVTCIEGGSCSQEDCDPHWSTLTSVKQEARGYECCSEYVRSDTEMCRYHDTSLNLQICAIRYHYSNPFCLGRSSVTGVWRFAAYTRSCWKPDEPTLV